MSKTMTLADAMKDKIVRIGHYFVTTMPKDRCAIVMESRVGWKERQKFQISAGEQKLWRLEEGLKMWGEPTKEELILQGAYGFFEGPCTMQRIIRELYGMTSVFNEVRACALPEDDYFFLDMKQILQEEERKYHHPDDTEMHYWLASRRSNANADKTTGLLVFVVSGIFFGNYWLGNLNGEEGTRSGSIRPEAYPNFSVLIETDGLDGTKERPWKILNK